MLRALRGRIARWAGWRRIAGRWAARALAPAVTPREGRRGPPDPMANTLDRMLRDLERSDALGKAAQLERVLKLEAALIVDLRNRLAKLERRRGG